MILFNKSNFFFLKHKFYVILDVKYLTPPFTNLSFHCINFQKNVPIHIQNLNDLKQLLLLIYHEKFIKTKVRL